MQAPLDPTGKAARPGPAFFTVKETSQFVPAAAGPTAAGPTRRRAPLLIGIGVATLALVAGGAFAAVRVLTPTGGSLIPSIGGTTQLTVTGEPPTTSGSWASGVRQVWHVSGEHDADGDQRDAGAFTGTFAASNSAWLLSDVIGDIAFGVWAFDPSDGRTLWDDWNQGNADLEGCAPATINGLTPCIESVTTGDTAQSRLALVDLHTGKTKTATSFEKLGITSGDVLDPDVDVEDGQIILTIPQFPDYSGEGRGALAGVVVAGVNAEGTTSAWVTKEPGCDQGSWQGPYSIPDAERVQHGAYFTRWGVAVDLKTGQALAGQGCLAPVADGAVVVKPRQGDSAPATLAAPDGFTYQVVTNGDGLSYVDHTPPQPLALTKVDLGESDEYGNATGTAKLTAVNPATGAPVWSDPPTVTVYEQDGIAHVGQASYDGQHLIVDDTYTLQSIDPSTGAVVWRQNFGDEETGYAISRLGDGTILLHGYEQSAAIDPDTGAILWSLTGDVEPVVAPDGNESLLELGGHDASSTWLARYDPADRPAATPTVPADAPSCPSGMTAISWTQYADGAILLCRADQSYAVVVPAHPDWQAASLTFTSGGYAVDFSNATSVRVSLGGNVVYTTANGTVSAAPVTASWNNAVGTVKLTAPSDLPTCPAGSWPISLSVYDGGWLLVCGTAADAPSAMYYNDGSGAREAGSVTAKNGGYCGTADIGTVCGYRSPSVVSVTDASGRVTQHSAGSNYFDGHGAGGTGRGNGSYGVETPDDNAKDQVRYLTQILQKSAAGRTNLQTAVDQVRACSDLAGAVDAFTGVLANRQELIDALDSTPVDAVPDGATLVASLRTALSLSHDSDQVWLQWAQAEQANGCADGEDSPLYQQVRSMNHDVAAAKDAFLTEWNTSIAPAYGAPTFRTSQI